MKKNIFYLLLFSSLIVASCSSDDDTSITPNEFADNTITVDVNGENFSSNNIETALLLSEGRFIRLTAVIATTFDLVSIEIGSINFDDPLLTEGIFSVSENNNNIQYNNFLSAISENPTGTITITNLDIENQIISGTFNGVATNIDGEMVTLTNGTFTNISFLVQ
ncbi:hypothetical protein [uncultured Dokdonia sp.]|uniref:hypothetical protein n=1 Tax=uncultured Dokdonia sp. TaxID=575653 RepID=UPI0026282A8E|nr:hypothetical protein [uncultured Dokdonia sp.]